MFKKNQCDGGNTIAPCWRQWCHSITAVSASAGSVLLSGLQRAAQAYTCFKDVSWAHPSILVTLHRPPPRTWSLEKNKKKNTSRNVQQSWVICCIHRPKSDTGWDFWSLQTLPEKAYCSLHHSDSIFTAMQGDPDITHNAQRQRASSPHPFRQSSCTVLV